MGDLIIKDAAFKRLDDERDYKWSDIGKAVEPFDWEKGYDIEEDLGFKIPIKDQGSSLSCGGQAFAYYAEVLEFLLTDTFEERSAKFLYSQCYCPGGGSRGRDLCKILKSQGAAREAFCPSYYQDGSPLSELDYQDTSTINNIVRNDAGGAKALDYAFLNQLTIDHVAQAIKANRGAVIGVSGENNGTWYSEFPKPPTTKEWGHWTVGFKAKLRNGKKMIGFPNSWGLKCGKDGWQWIGEDYFNTVAGGYYAVWEAWTMILKKPDEKRNLLITLLLTLLSKIKKI